MINQNMEIKKGNEEKIMKLACAVKSVIATNKDHTLSVVYQKKDNFYLCVIRKTGSDRRIKEEPIQVTNEEFKNVIHNCFKDNYFFQFYNKTNVLTWD